MEFKKKYQEMDSGVFFAEIDERIFVERILEGSSEKSKAISSTILTGTIGEFSKVLSRRIL